MAGASAAPAAGDGSETVAGISYAAVDATSAATDITSVGRDAEVDLGALTYADEDSDGNGGQDNAVSQLADLGILARARGA